MIKKLFQRYFTSGFFLNVPLVINTIIALFTLPIILANLPIVDYGKWQFILAVQSWLLTFTGSNITYAAKRGIAKGLNGTFLHAFLTRLKLLILVGILTLGAAFYLKISGYHILPMLLAILGLYLIVGHLFQISFYEFLIAKKRFKEWSFWQILIPSTSMLGSALVAFFTKKIIFFASFQLGSISVLGLIAWFKAVKKERLVKSYKKGEIDKECVPYGLKLIPIDVVTVTSTRAADFIIGPFFGFTNLAIFSVAIKLSRKFTTIIKSARPMLYADFAKKERSELIRIMNRYLVKIGILSLFLTFGFIGVGWIYIKLFLPKTFHPAIIYFAILTLGLPAAILAVVLHTILESHLRYKELIATGIFPNLLKIMLILVFGYFWGVIGVCGALAISTWISFGFYYLLTVKRDLAMRMIEKFRLSNF
jgi:O-antigen/teichoic acid export membrane protein